MKLSSVSRMVSTRGLGAIGVALGLMAGCGDDEGAAHTPGDAAVTASSDAGAVETTGEEPGETLGGNNGPGDASGQAGGDDAGGGGPDDGRADGGNPAAGCGGEGEPCCEAAECNGGFVCVGAGPQPPDFGADGGGGFGFGDLIGLLDDAGLLAADGGLGLPGFDAGGLIAPPPEAVGVCEACGGEGEPCCADDACNGGFSCEVDGFGPTAVRACVAEVVSPGDAGRSESTDAASGGEEGCGGAGQVCCRESVRQDPYCNDGFECDDPRGRDLEESSCVATGGNASGDAAAACGGEEQPCCEGRGGRGVCDDGLDCESHAPRGLEGDVCVED